MSAWLDEAAEYDFDRFHEVYYPQVVRHAYSITGDPARAHRLALAAFHHAWRHWDQLTANDPISWIHRHLAAHARSRPGPPATAEPLDPQSTIAAHRLRANVFRKRRIRRAQVTVIVVLLMAVAAMVLIS